MFIVYCVLAVLYAAMLIFSGITKLQVHPEAVRVIHELVGVPLGLFPVLATLEFPPQPDSSAESAGPASALPPRSAPCSTSSAPSPATCGWAILLASAAPPSC